MDKLDLVTFLSLIVTACLGGGAYWFGSIVRRASRLTKFQTYSKSVDESLLDSGIYTEHGIVYDPATKVVVAQHGRSQLFQESLF